MTGRVLTQPELCETPSSCVLLLHHLLALRLLLHLVAVLCDHVSSSSSSYSYSSSSSFSSFPSPSFFSRPSPSIRLHLRGHTCQLRARHLDERIPLFERARIFSLPFCSTEIEHEAKWYMGFNSVDFRALFHRPAFTWRFLLRSFFK